MSLCLYKKVTLTIVYLIFPGDETYFSMLDSAWTGVVWPAQ